MKNNTHPQYDRLTMALNKNYIDTILGLLKAIENKSIYHEDFEIKVFGKLIKNFNHRETLDLIPVLCFLKTPNCYLYNSSEDKE